MLSPELVKKIRRIHIKSARTVNTIMAGQYKSVFRGAGIEFEEVREYSPGDDVKNIDWKVSARLGRPYIKLYQEERELVVMLLVDMSGSCGFGTTTSLKQETAAEVAAIIAFNAIKNNDKVGAILFSDHVEKYIPPKKGSLHIWRVIKEFFTFRPTHKTTDIQSAISYLAKVSRKRTITFLISDFLSPDYLCQLKIASKRHEIISILISDPGEFRLPEHGIVSLTDIETGKQLLLDASDKQTGRNFKKLKNKEYSNTLEVLKTADVDCIEISTADSVADALIKYFRYREKISS
jgi:uncharacterized protein (DUF58 family)